MAKRWALTIIVITGFSLNIWAQKEQDANMKGMNMHHDTKKPEKNPKNSARLPQKNTISTKTTFGKSKSDSSKRDDINSSRSTDTRTKDSVPHDMDHLKDLDVNAHSGNDSMKMDHGGMNKGENTHMPKMQMRDTTGAGKQE